MGCNKDLHIKCVASLDNKTKNIIILGALAVASLTTVTSCNDFEDINKDPNKADLEQVEPEWFLNGRTYFYFVLEAGCSF